MKHVKPGVNQVCMCVSISYRYRRLKDIKIQKKMSSSTAVKSSDESLFTTLYHSGVGWLSDILETEVFVDVSFF